MSWDILVPLLIHSGVGLLACCSHMIHSLNCYKPHMWLLAHPGKPYRPPESPRRLETAAILASKMNSWRTCTSQYMHDVLKTHAALQQLP